MGHPLMDVPGARCGRRLGAAVLALGGELKRGIDAVLDACGFDRLLESADLVISGEGRVDAQSVCLWQGNRRYLPALHGRRACPWR